jgi:4-hydroxy-4-methyl-2-oxoglutarate aldolase
MNTATASPVTTANIADACLRLGIAIRCAPQSLRPVIPGSTLAGRAVPVQHFGSVDVFMEAVERACDGDVLVIDNGGRTDEGCIGDLVALEVREAGLAGMVVWGSHRDTDELVQIGLPVFSSGVHPVGPREARPRIDSVFSHARIGDLTITPDDYVFADSDGILFVPQSSVADVVATAAEVHVREARQAVRARNGTSLRQQFKFQEYLRKREANPSVTFREHLRGLAAEIEE